MVDILDKSLGAKLIFFVSIALTQLRQPKIITNLISTVNDFRLKFSSLHLVEDFYSVTTDPFQNKHVVISISYESQFAQNRYFEPNFVEVGLRNLGDKHYL